MAELERLTEPAQLGEGPCWHAQEKVLYWIDILGKKLHCFDPQTNSDRSWDVGQLIGTVAPRAAGGLILALQNGFAFFDPATGSLEHLDPIETNHATRFNDGKCDPRGRFWCGSMDIEEKQFIGNLYRLDPDRTIRKFATEIGISNGMGWSLDRSTMYYVDSPTSAVFAFDYDLDSGDVTNRRELFRLSEEQGYPDGMTVDQEGMIWLAHWGGSRVCRWDPDSGSVLERYDTPAPHTTACCFGGDDLTDLYITTARKGLSEPEIQEFPESGCLFRLKTKVQGSPTFAYAG